MIKQIIDDLSDLYTTLRKLAHSKNKTEDEIYDQVCSFREKALKITETYSSKKITKAVISNNQNQGVINEQS